MEEKKVEKKVMDKEPMKIETIEWGTKDPRLRETKFFNKYEKSKK
jgi:hypothetical protein